MTIQFDVTVRNARADAWETAIGVSPILKIRTGAPPANCAAADSGTVLATVNLPSDFAANASGGSKSLAGVWQDASCDNAGTAGHYRLYSSDGTTCREQGTVTATGGGGDLTLDNAVIATAQVLNITSHTLTEANA